MADEDPDQGKADEDPGQGKADKGQESTLDAIDLDRKTNMAKTRHL
jgi:hypothetical protein